MSKGITTTSPLPKSLIETLDRAEERRAEKEMNEEPKSYQISGKLRKCPFCDRSTDEGMTLNKQIMLEYDGDENDWAHLECYIHYLVKKYNKMV